MEPECREEAGIERRAFGCREGKQRRIRDDDSRLCLPGLKAREPMTRDRNIRGARGLSPGYTATQLQVYAGHAGMPPGLDLVYTHSHMFTLTHGTLTFTHSHSYLHSHTRVIHTFTHTLAHTYMNTLTCTLIPPLTHMLTVVC